MEKIKPVIVLVVFIWAVFLIEFAFSLNFAKFGIAPRNLVGLRGILLAPFIHGNIYHIISNTLPLAVLGSILFIFYTKNAYQILLFSILLSGVGVWIFARPSFHIGISGVIYALATFIIFAGFYKKQFLSIIISIVVVIAYGGLIWGLLPGKVDVSFEGHLAGAISGVILAGAYYKKK